MARSRVLVLIKGLGIGGAERLVVESAERWNRERFSYRVGYLVPWMDPLVPELERLGVEVTCLGGPRGRVGGAAVRLRLLVRRHQIDLIHAHLPSTGVLARLVSPVPVVYTEHNVVDSYRLSSRVANRLTYRRNRSVIAVSEAVADSVASYGAKVITIPNGVSCQRDEEATAKARAELRLGEKDSLVVHVGNIRPHKGHQTLLAAAAQLLRRRPEVVMVSVGGEQKPGDLERLQAEARAMGIAGRMRFLGRRKDARAFLGAADVVVNPSDFEGLPVALLEAMAQARPVIATAVGGVPSIIREGETGLLVPPADPGRLAVGIERLLDDRELALRVGEHAREVVEREYGVERMVRATEAVYEEVLGSCT